MASPLHAAFAAPGSSPGTRPIWCVDTESWPARRNTLPAYARAFAESAGFKPEAGRHLLVPGKEGVAGALFALDAPSKRDTDRFMPGKLAGVLPEGIWRFAAPPPDARLAALAFALGRYRFDRYSKKKSKDAKAPRLELPKGIDGVDLTRIVEAVYLVRDLVNTPANDLGPAELAAAARKLAARHGAKISVVSGQCAQEELSAGERGGTGERTRAAARRSGLGQAEASEGHARRQGRRVRYRRPRYQARQRDAADEEGQGRRGAGTRARAHDHGREASDPAARHHPCGREFGLRHRVPAGRRFSEPQGHFGRDRQHGRGGQADPCRCPGACR